MNTEPKLRPDKTASKFQTAPGAGGPPDYSFIAPRLKHLQRLIAAKEEALAGKPEGSLKIQSKGKHDYYFQIIHGGSPSRTYLPQTQAGLIHALAQKGYDRKILYAARKELAALESLQKQLPEMPAESIYVNLSDGRKKLVTPVFIPDEEYLQRWAETEYTPKPFSDDAPQFYTERNERVRSKSEVILANLLLRKGLAYKYECPLLLKSGNVIYPDFTILDIRRRREIYLEHLGMMDDSYYSESAADRIALYEENGIFPGDRLIFTLETRRHPLNIRAAERLLDFYFKKR